MSNLSGPGSWVNVQSVIIAKCDKKIVTKYDNYYKVRRNTLTESTKNKIKLHKIYVIKNIRVSPFIKWFLAFK